MFQKGNVCWRSTYLVWNVELLFIFAARSKVFVEGFLAFQTLNLSKSFSPLHVLCAFVHIISVDRWTLAIPWINFAVAQRLQHF